MKIFGEKGIIYLPRSRLPQAKQVRTTKLPFNATRRHCLPALARHGREGWRSLASTNRQCLCGWARRTDPLTCHSREFDVHFSFESFTVVLTLSLSSSTDYHDSVHTGSRHLSRQSSVRNLLRINIYGKALIDGKNIAHLASNGLETMQCEQAMLECPRSSTSVTLAPDVSETV